MADGQLKAELLRYESVVLDGDDSFAAPLVVSKVSSAAAVSLSCCLRIVVVTVCTFLRYCAAGAMIR